MNDRNTPNEAFEPRRESVHIAPRQLVRHGDEIYRIDHVLNYTNVIGVNLVTGRFANLRINELRALTPEDDPRISLHRDVADFEGKDWQEADERFKAIKPLLDSANPTREQVQLRAQQLNKDVSTIYRWIQRYKAHGVTSALIPIKRGWQAGKSRLNPDQDAIIAEVLNDYYLKGQRPTIAKTVQEVERRCSLRGIKEPSASAVQKRIAEIPEKIKLRRRGSREKAENLFTPTPGKFPGADYRLAVVQIDHTPIDVIVVDDEHRKPIGRPWLTLAIDVCTRMVTGYHLSFDEPSITSVALCLTNAVLPKDDCLVKHGVNAEWPVWGFPTKLHSDNGADFRSASLKRSCTEYGILHEFRMHKKPRYGGHIERLMGTFMTEIHDLPGTTFSSIEEKGEYDPEKHAVLTRAELEKWVVHFITRVYHQKKHKVLEMSPARKWELEVFGSDDKPALGLPPVPSNGHTILLDFLPFEMRTVQPNGVSLDNLTYYSEVLNPYINTTDPETGEKRKFIFRRDPRDVSVLWFFEPQLKQYFQLPTAEKLPPLSLWEYRELQEYSRQQGGVIDKAGILAALTEMREMVDQATANTKSARRRAQKRRDHKNKSSVPAAVNEAAQPPEPAARPTRPAHQPSPALLDDDEVPSFGDVS